MKITLPNAANNVTAREVKVDGNLFAVLPPDENECDCPKGKVTCNDVMPNGKSKEFEVGVNPALGSPHTPGAPTK